jgi:NADH-quinone oxidoreductase subunit N
LENIPVPDLVSALTGYFPYLVPEMILGVAACVLFLGGTWRAGRNLWGAAALLALAGAGIALGLLPLAHYSSEAAGETARFASPLAFDRLALFIRVISLAGGAILVLLCWDVMPDDQAADFHACLLLLVAGMGLSGAANELITLFLALELVSIPTYVLLYLPRVDAASQEAAMKYFLLSIFSSALTLFGFSYLYGLGGTTNLPALADALGRAQGSNYLPAVALVALVMIVAGLGFRITAVPFHFYAPDVYQGTATPLAALLAYVPKVAGFAALFRVLGFVVPVVVNGTFGSQSAGGQVLGEQVPVLLWIISAVTMSLGNVLGLLQDNLKRLLAYSSVAHAGYMLIGLAAAPRLFSSDTSPIGGVEAVLFYLVAYGAMTIGAFAVIHYLSSSERPVETMEDVAGLGRRRPGMALLLVLFLFSLIGIPLTAGFVGKVWLFLGALGVPYSVGNQASLDQARLYRILALIGALNAAVGAWYYLRIAAVMFLREPATPPVPLATVSSPAARPRRSLGALLAVWICAGLTLFFGIYPTPLLRAVKTAAPRAITSTAQPPEMAAR